MVSKSELKQSYKDLVRQGKASEALLMLRGIQTGNTVSQPVIKTVKVIQPTVVKPKK
jgi:hypothetical protein